MFPSGSIFDCIARVTSLPTRQTESPALDYGEPLESFWKHSPSLLSQVQGIRLKEVTNKTRDRPDHPSKFCRCHSGAIWFISTPCTQGSLRTDPCRVWSWRSLSSGGKIHRVARTRCDSPPQGNARRFGAPAAQLWSWLPLFISKQAAATGKLALVALLVAETPWTQKRHLVDVQSGFLVTSFSPNLTPVSSFFLAIMQL